ACALLACVAFAPKAHAQSCSITSGTGTLVDFAAYTAMSGTVDASGTVSLNCTPLPPLNLPVAYSVSIGTGSSNSYVNRYLTFGASSLNYNLFTDVTRLIVFGDGVTSGTQKKSGTCSGACGVTVYGRITSGQSVPAGSYSDQVVIT